MQAAGYGPLLFAFCTPFTQKRDCLPRTDSRRLVFVVHKVDDIQIYYRRYVKRPFIRKNH